MLSKIRAKLKRLRTVLKFKKKPKSKKADLAHRPGHRKMGKAIEPKKPIKDEPLNELTRADLIRKKNSSHRRIITGATMGKTGRITVKE